MGVLIASRLTRPIQDNLHLKTMASSTSARTRWVDGGSLLHRSASCTCRGAQTGQNMHRGHEQTYDSQTHASNTNINDVSPRLHGKHRSGAGDVLFVANTFRVVGFYDFVELGTAVWVCVCV